jgi:hypothetical protein
MRNLRIAGVWPRFEPNTSQIEFRALSPRQSARRVVREKFIVSVLDKKLEGKLPCTEDPATGTDPEQMNCVLAIARFRI